MTQSNPAAASSTTETPSPPIAPAPVSAPPAPQADAAADRSFRPDVEGLRAIAVLLIVLFHAGVTWPPGRVTLHSLPF